MSRTASGLKAWVLQRATAVYIGLFSLYFLLQMLLAPPDDWVQWRALFAATPMAVAMLVFMLAILLHAWVGVRDVLIDYVKPFWLRLSLLTLIALILVACGLWTLQLLILARLN
ncbi:MAG: succinate dehydrogenase, hydrophobic membrane anchor protein [Gammaproteobacteria bacterium]|nr:MAG: succinate dehydrogenase, hydrophobic membrane anchor protein [Gammaproteobacteria bacterium]